jgi:hypothetical protein
MKTKEPTEPDVAEPPDIKLLNGMTATCPQCYGKSDIVSTISAHRWGWMVEFDCGHIGPVVLA